MLNGKTNLRSICHSAKLQTTLTFYMGCGKTFVSGTMKHLWKLKVPLLLHDCTATNCITTPLYFHEDHVEHLTAANSLFHKTGWIFLALVRMKAFRGVWEGEDTTLCNMFQQGNNWATGGGGDLGIISEPLGPTFTKEKNSLDSLDKKLKFSLMVNQARF